MTTQQCHSRRIQLMFLTSGVQRERLRSAMLGMQPIHQNVLEEPSEGHCWGCLTLSAADQGRRPLKNEKKKHLVNQKIFKFGSRR